MDDHASHVQLYSFGWQFSASQSQFFTSCPQWFLITRGRPTQPVSLRTTTKTLSGGIRAEENAAVYFRMGLYFEMGLYSNGKPE